jgi:DNA-binding CsgD family transcriptional regulator
MFMYAKLFASKVHNSLTKREQEIFSWVAQGYSTKEIAARLFLSEYTIFTHRRNILRKRRMLKKTC